MRHSLPRAGASRSPPRRAEVTFDRAALIFNQAKRPDRMATGSAARCRLGAARRRIPARSAEMSGENLASLIPRGRNQLAR
jgi:hypothetical protein